MKWTQHQAFDFEQIRDMPCKGKKIHEAVDHMVQWGAGWGAVRTTKRKELNPYMKRHEQFFSHLILAILVFIVPLAAKVWGWNKTMRTTPTTNNTK